MRRNAKEMLTRQPKSSFRATCVHRGFSLVELMVALTISLVILAAISQIFVASRSTYTLEEGLARTQEAGRFAMEFLTQDIRMAGYAGCNSQLPSTSINNVAQPATTAYQFLAGGIRGYRYAGTGSNNLTDWNPDLPADFFSNGQVRAGTDVVIIQRGSTLDTSLTGNMGVVNATIQILGAASLAGQIQADDILMISDCKNADIFRATGVSNTSGTVTIAHANNNNTSNNLSKAYTTQAQIMKLVSRAYYIGTGESGEPSLMRKNLANSGAAPIIAAEELVEGIEDMRIMYGEDTDATSDNVPNLYRLADSVANWEKIVGMRVGFLARTTSDVDQRLDTKTHAFDGITMNPTDDHRRRQLFLSTVQVRN
jgi:type IV pilus assembly protein PilW